MEVRACTVPAALALPQDARSVLPSTVLVLLPGGFGVGSGGTSYLQGHGEPWALIMES